MTERWNDAWKDGGSSRDDDPDPLEALAANWRSGEPPLVGEDLEVEPADLREAIEPVLAHLRAQAPDAERAEHARDAVLAIARDRRRVLPAIEDARPRSVAPLVPLLAAAAVLLLLAAAAWLGARASRDAGNPRDPKHLASGAGSDGEIPGGELPGAGDPGPEQAVDRGPADAGDGGNPDAPRIAAVTADRIEMRSGNVRLVWLTGNAPEATPQQPDPSSTSKDENR